MEDLIVKLREKLPGWPVQLTHAVANTGTAASAAQSSAVNGKPEAEVGSGCFFGCIIKVVIIPFSRLMAVASR